MILFATALQFFLMNAGVVVNSNILLSGVREFNALVKYMLLQDNYIAVSSFYGLLFAILWDPARWDPMFRTEISAF